MTIAYPLNFSAMKLRLEILEDIYGTSETAKKAINHHLK